MNNIFLLNFLFRFGRNSELEQNHHKFIYKTKTVAKECLITTTECISHSISSKSTSKRKQYKSYTHIQSKQLVYTPAVKMIYKRRQDDEVLPPSKRRKSSPFKEEIDDDEVKRPLTLITLETLFDVNTNTIRRIDHGIPHQRENLASLTDSSKRFNHPDVREKSGPKIKRSSIALTTERPPVTIKEEIVNDDVDLPEVKPSVRVPVLSPVEEKYNFDESKEDINHNGPIDTTDVNPSLGVHHVIDIAPSSHDAPITPYIGQILWVRHSKCPFWPAIVCKYTDDERSKFKIFCPNKKSPTLISILPHFLFTLSVHVKFFAYSSRKPQEPIETHQRHVFDFQGIDSFLPYKKTSVRLFVCGGMIVFWLKKMFFFFSSQAFQKLSKNQKANAFNVRKSKSWTKAVAEGTLMLSKDLNSRMAFFDIIFIG